MIQKLMTICFLFLYSLTAQSQNKVPVFISGQEGYASFRIPAMIQLPNKKIIAFAEGRVNGAADFGHVNIVMKSSIDRGAHWSKLTKYLQ